MVVVGIEEKNIYFTANMEEEEEEEEGLFHTNAKKT